MHFIKRSLLGGCVLLAATTLTDSLLSTQIIFEPAWAIVGRPLTPVSAAGVARRTTRRVVRTSTIYVSTLPTTCTPVMIEGTSLYACGNTYYQTSGSQYVVVYVD